MEEIDKKRFKEILVEVFKVFISICEQHKLQYFCIGGTLIGAIRHKGFIPWDDDIDVIMPREDYDRFLEITESLNGNYSVIYPKPENNYCLPFAKMYDNSTFIQEAMDIKGSFGVFVDIFPLDSIAGDKTQREEQVELYRSIAGKLRNSSRDTSAFVKEAIRFFLKWKFKQALSNLNIVYNRMAIRERILKQIDDLVYKRTVADWSYLVNYGGAWGIKEIFNNEWFNDFLMKDFEGLSVRIPVGYHELLCSVYGDYLQLPPREKRVSHHHFVQIKFDLR